MPIVLPTSTPNRPTMTVEVDFVNDPTSVTETWTNITAYVRTKGLDATLLSSSRGRNYELAKSTPGKLQLALDNTDGRFDPSNVASPYGPAGTGNPSGAAGLITPGRRIRIRATWQGITYGVWRGFVNEWPQEWEDAGFYGKVNLDCTGALAVLAQIELPPSTVTEVLKDNPLGLYRCNDGAGSVGAGNSSSYNQPLAAMVAGSTTNPATDDFTFGGDQPTGDPALGGDPSPSLVLSTTSWNGFTNPHGYALRTSDQGTGPLLQLAAGFTVECWVKTNNRTHNANSTLAVQFDRAGVQQTLLALYAVSGGYSVQFVANDRSSGSAVATGTKIVSDGKWHHVMGTLAADKKTVALYIDGVAQAGLFPAATALVWNEPAMNEWGGDPKSNFKTGTAWLDGSLKNLALYNAPLSASRALAHYNSGKTFAGEASGTRVGRILDACVWPSTLRNLAAGDSTVGVQALEGNKALTALETVVDTEQGVLFEDRDGKVGFQNRRARFDSASLATFGDGTGELRYSDSPTFTLDDKDVYNDVTVSRQGGISVRDQSPASIARYNPRTLSVETVAVDDAAVVYTSQYLLDRYQGPVTRVAELTMTPTSDVTLWPTVLGREIGDRITVTRRPGGASSSTPTGDFYVESVSHTVTGSTWTTKWELSPASISSYLQMNSATYGHLGGSSTLTALMLTGSSTATVDATSVSFSTTDTPYTIQVDGELMTVTAAAAPSGGTQVLTVSRNQPGSYGSRSHTSGTTVTLANAQKLAF